ncbi:polymer-forming cytoskeletal protein [Clostridium sp. Marseille-Q2269]|uniref:bactofilin family protein n=1 Tax=Clostridium sp. Marseille-Q2269 TaxID=2942205 RepID=UPI0020737C66|nr:polymer-forming cytoskeletal protein [Clostridium sp. Marseille-Q2269]
MKKIYFCIVIVMLCLFSIPIHTVKASNSYTVVEGVVKFNENIYIQPGEVENGDVISIGSDIYVNGVVNGDVTSIGGNVYINGKVTGDVTSMAGKVTKGPKGDIKGDVKEKFEKAKIPFRNINIENIKFSYSRISVAILLLILCIVVYNVMPYNEMRMASAIDKELGKNLVYGYASIILTFILLIILLFSIVGIILIPIVCMALLIVFLMGFTAISLYVGKRFLKSKVSPMVAIFIGVAFYELIRSIVFLGLGHIISILFIIPLSIGIVVKSKFGSFRPWRRLNTTDDWNDFWKH